MITFGFRIPASDVGDHAPSASTSTRPLEPFAKIGALFKQVGHAGYLNVVYGAPGTSASPSGFVLYPLCLLSSGFSVSNAPLSKSSFRKVAHAGFRFDSQLWNSSRGISCRQLRQTRARKNPCNSMVGRFG